ncbi:unnamed protein product [Acanthoscelides obtectus]|uniref:EF-hand domain-containing protein n=1 Tax=Acanthoscelides obtectus TaxID=200917 RepID=A0A9P0L224_ACAOB|nr:unnamed protein product [Acanthoscelides obtectus]CAK1638398.1 Calexcitin-2 [Acanthoscelides obtectus]
MWDDYSKQPESALEWQNQYLRFMFELEDASGDGSIDIDEFTSGKNEVNYEQFVDLWQQFFTSENPEDPGNYIFGKTKF